MKRTLPLLPPIKTQYKPQRSTDYNQPYMGDTGTLVIMASNFKYRKIANISAAYTKKIKKISRLIIETGIFLRPAYTKKMF